MGRAAQTGQKGRVKTTHNDESTDKIFLNQNSGYVGLGQQGARNEDV